MPILGLGAILLSALRRKTGLITWLLFLFFICAESIHYAYGTLFTYFVFLAATLIVSYLYVRRRLPYVWIGLGLLLLTPIYQNRHVSRASVWKMENRSPTKVWSIGCRIITDSYQAFDGNLFKDVEKPDNEIDRFENTTFLAQCIYKLDNGKPLKWGETFWYIPMAFIPRLVFPWKPVNTHCDRLPEEYGCKEANWNCAINFPWFAEWYINFGSLGAIVGCGIMGLVFGFFVRLTDCGRGDYNLALLLQQITWYLRVEADIVMVISGLIQISLVWYGVSLFLKYQSGDLGTRTHLRGRRSIPLQVLPACTLNPIKPGGNDR